MGMMFAYVLDFNTATLPGRIHHRPHSPGVWNCRATARKASCHFDNGKVSLRFDVKDGVRHLTVELATVW